MTHHGSIEKLSNYIFSAQGVLTSLESVSIYYGAIYFCSFIFFWIWLYYIIGNIIPFQITQPQFTQSNQLLTFWSLPSGKSLWEVLLFQYWWCSPQSSFKQPVQNTGLYLVFSQVLSRLLPCSCAHTSMQCLDCIWYG